MLSRVYEYLHALSDLEKKDAEEEMAPLLSASLLLLLACSYAVSTGL